MAARNETRVRPSQARRSPPPRRPGPVNTVYAAGLVQDIVSKQMHRSARGGRVGISSIDRQADIGFDPPTIT